MPRVGSNPSLVCFNTCIGNSAVKFYACPGGQIGKVASLKRKKVLSSTLSQGTRIASETWKSERPYRPFSARLAFLRGFDPLRWYQDNGK